MASPGQTRTGAALMRSAVGSVGRCALAACGLLLMCCTASAVVVRHDVGGARYRVPAEEFPALADLPGEGHAVLIAPRWLVTAAHAVQWQPVQQVMLNGKPRPVERLVFHPGYRKLPQGLTQGDAAPAMAFLAATDDIALIELAEPVADVEPVALYRGENELGQRVKLYGKGAGGNGIHGQDLEHGNRTVLRRAFNTVSSVDERWLGYRFDADGAAQALEGMPGNGDSGGPVLIEAQGQWQLAGLASWKHWQGELEDFRGGMYGQTSYQVRLSRYAQWIEEVMGHALEASPVVAAPALRD